MPSLATAVLTGGGWGESVRKPGLSVTHFSRVYPKGDGVYLEILSPLRGSHWAVGIWGLHGRAVGDPEAGIVHTWVETTSSLWLRPGPLASETHILSVCPV